jgi:hypothetical protein
MHTLRAVRVLSLASLLTACGSVTMTGGTGGQTGGGTGGMATGGNRGGGTGGMATGGNHGGGTGGMATGGNRGSGGETCAQLQDDYTAALPQARSCSASSGGSQCDQQAPSMLGCDCQTFVNDKGALDQIQQRWTIQGCQALCPAIACLAPRSGACRAADAGGAACTDVYTP